MFVSRSDGSWSSRRRLSAARIKFRVSDNFKNRIARARKRAAGSLGTSMGMKVGVVRELARGLRLIPK
jgi:hypothetical protein